MLHLGQRRIGTMALVGAAVAAVLWAAPARAQEAMSLDCGLASTIRSFQSKTPATIEFVNETLGPILVSWIDFQGRAQPYITLQPGQANVFQTYLTHPWMVTGAADGRCQGNYLPTQRPGRVLVVPSG